MTFFYLVKDYIEVVHKLIETSPSHVLQHSTYTDSLTILSFGLSSFKQLVFSDYCPRNCNFHDGRNFCFRWKFS